MKTFRFGIGCARQLYVVLGCALANVALALTPDEQAEMVAAHNRWRQEARVPKLRWSASLAKRAQGWADQLKQNQCAMAHSGSRDAGENLYWASPIRFSGGAAKPQQVSPMRVVDAWGSEKRDYDYAGNTCARGKMCGHYTQVVWRTTTDVGCARAVCDDHAQVWVCNYAPPGNWRGQRPF